MSSYPPPGQNPGQQGGYGQSYGQPPTAYGQAPYGQQGYGYQQPYGAPPPNQYSSSGSMDPKVAAGLSYLLGWIGGLVFFLIEKQNRFVRVHAMQSLLYNATLLVVEIVLVILLVIFAIISASVDAMASIVVLFSALLWLVPIAFLIGWLVAMINAFQGKTFKLPLIGDWAERIVK